MKKELYINKVRYFNNGVINKYCLFNTTFFIYNNNIRINTCSWLSQHTEKKRSTYVEIRFKNIYKVKYYF